MTEIRKRKVHRSEFKAKVGLEGIRGLRTTHESGQEHGVHPVQVGQWKKEIVERAKTLFEGKRGPKVVDEHSDEERLYGEMGRLKMALDGLKNSLGRAVSDPASMDRSSRAEPLAPTRQCERAGVSRSWL